LDGGWTAKQRVGVKVRFTLLDAIHELTPAGKIERVHFRKLIFDARKFLRSLFDKLPRRGPYHGD
jgi:hypothetical protein